MSSPTRPSLDRLRFQVNPLVFGVSVAVIVTFVIASIVATDTIGDAFEQVQETITAYFGWYYVLAVATFLVFCLWLASSRFGRLRLGEEDERPRYRYLTWFAMLFTAGMGIGLVFWAVAEPLSHLANPPQADPGTDLAATDAMHLTFFHWGLHAWGVYAVVGLCLAYFAYRHRLPLTIRSALYPLLGDRIHGRLGDSVDIFAVFGTMFGVATSLGFGIIQVNAGLDHLGLLERSTTSQVVLVIAITLAACGSLMVGLDKGILRLSVANMSLATLLLTFVLATGPTLYILNSFVEQVGTYLQRLPATTFSTDALGDGGWHASWTIFYWGWWISWSPFVGMFIARISRGRTVREFVVGVLGVPTLLTFGWLATFGNAAIDVERRGVGDVAEAVADDVGISLFVLFEQLPLTTMLTVLAVVVIATYFVTSSDSASLVIDMLSSDGNTESPRSQRAFWALLEGAVAIALLLAGGGGLLALQTAAITTALPFSLIMFVMAYGLVRALYSDAKRRPLARVVLAEPDHESVPEQHSNADPGT